MRIPSIRHIRRVEKDSRIPELLYPSQPYQQQCVAAAKELRVHGEWPHNRHLQRRMAPDPDGTAIVEGRQLQHRIRMILLVIPLLLLLRLDDNDACSQLIWELFNIKGPKTAPAGTHRRKTPAVPGKTLQQKLCWVHVQKHGSGSVHR